MAMKDELENYVGKELVVIMVDGRGYRGKLAQIDEDLIVLKNVYETLNQEVDERGYMFWRRVLHSEVMIRLPMVMRVWPWDAPRKKSKEKKSKKK